jgi:hypothetical protein
MDFDYKKYSLQRLEEWTFDAISSGEATPREIYDTIKNVVQEQYDYYKNGAGKTNELLSLLNGNGVGHISAYDDYLHMTDNGLYTDPAGNNVYFYESDDPAPYCKGSWNDFWGNDTIKEDKVTKWRLPVEVDAASDDYYVQFPDDLLEAANLKEGDKVEWVDNGNGSYLLRKVSK